MLTYTAKKADGTNGADRTENLIFPEQKDPETTERQQFPGLQSEKPVEVPVVCHNPNSFEQTEFCNHGPIILKGMSQVIIKKSKQSY